MPREITPRAGSSDPLDKDTLNKIALGEVATISLPDMDQDLAEEQASDFYKSLSTSGQFQGKDIKVEVRPGDETGVYNFLLSIRPE